MLTREFVSECDTLEFGLKFFQKVPNSTFEDFTIDAFYTWRSSKEYLGFTKVTTEIVHEILVYFKTRLENDNNIISD